MNVPNTYPVVHKAVLIQWAVIRVAVILASL